MLLNKFSALLQITSKICKDLTMALLFASRSQKLKILRQARWCLQSNTFQSGRTTLLSGLLRTVASNKSAALPIRIFEIGDTILRDTSKPVGARNQKYCDYPTSFLNIQECCRIVLWDHIRSSGMQVVSFLSNTI